MIAYLAQAIDRNPAGSLSRRLADRISTELAEHKLSVFRPSGGWEIDIEADPKIQRINEAALALSDVVIAVLLHADRTIGVPWEMALAVQQGIPLVVHTDMDPNMVMLAHLAGSGATICTYPEATVRAAAAAPPRDRGLARWDGSGEAPRSGSPGDAGFDLVVSRPVTIEPGGFADVPSDVAVQLPPGMWALITGRSSSWKKRILVKDSVIDAGFRGVLFASCLNLGSEPVHIDVGDRVAQIIPMPLAASGIHWEKCQLDSSDRGAAGFGSTGR
jgi:dUTP pyrophosphatase